MTNHAKNTADIERLEAARKGKTVGAVVHAGQILRLLQSSREPATATQISRKLDINPSTCFNILQTLIDEDFVSYNEEGKTYALSLGILPLARGALNQNSELQLLQPKLEEFAQQFGVTAAVNRRISRDHCVLAAVVESDAPIRIHSTAGLQSPILLGATGRVFAAYSNMTEAELREKFSALRLARTLDFETFLAQIKETRETGWAIDDGYYHAGTISLAAPVHTGSASVSLCCSVLLFNGQFDPKKISLIAQKLVAICDSVSKPAQILALGSKK